MSVRARRPLALAAAVATAAALGATVLATAGAPTAAAAETPLSGYELTWGIKQSYRTYVTTYAAGTFTATDGATQAADNGAFTFVDGTGTYDTTAHTLDLGFKGSLNIVSQAHGFDITLSDVKFDSATTEITADVTKTTTSATGATPVTTKSEDAPLATVTVTRDMKDMATKLTAEAADILGSASYADAAGDPLTLVQKTTSQSPDPDPSDSTSPSPSNSDSTSPSPSNSESASGSASPSPSASASQTPTAGEITDGTLGWGVKESFRTYVVSGVAQGEITASGGATQATGNGVFTFVDGTGTYDTDADTLSASFEGAVNFKGHEDNGTYGLDLTLSDLKAELDGGTGELTADVESLGEKSEDVVLAKLKAPSAQLTVEDDVIELDDVTATLTDAGAEAFGGFYTTGTELDPVDLAVAVDEDAQLPGGDDESTPSASATSTTTGGTGTTGSTTGGDTGSLASTGSDVPAGALGAAAAVTVAAGAGVVLAVRRRRTVS
ncbi:HtaA domain-containing protein [Streptomyces sp. NBC_00038]|uniref:HtaA domain-containing protein n=1 Tax=Streptomyces sp. NBC_00038 TaxID=2903615 RepID=UPI0022576C44|nr:HtaA domain-containing protein [Streptomyces sp. NBC_00038]MCX5557174.1 HtaA domain-containing protein [Streptomyces sp. NBC_00038]